MATVPPKAADLGDLMRVAGQIARDSRKDLGRELKPDGSIVTNGDRNVETWLREHLTSFVPGSAVWGEEFGFEEAGPGGLWLVDPVDGTSNYSFGSPMWGVSVALFAEGRIELGSIYLPDLDELYLAEHGQGAYMNEARIPNVPPGQIQNWELVSYSEHLPKDYPQLVVPGKMRCTGSFVIDGAFVAMQRFRGLIGRREKLYDVAAAVLLGQETALDIRYTDGTLPDWQSLARPGKIQKPWIMFPKENGFFFDGPPKT